MSIQAVAWAIEQTIPAGPKLVLISIANHANHTDGYCWLKAETIAAEASCTARGVYRIIAALIRNGYIRKERRRSENGKQRATDYWILFGRLEASWDWGKGVESEDERETQDVVGEDEQDDPVSLGDDPLCDAVDKQFESCGPSDSGRPPIRIAEPSKIKPEKDARERTVMPPRRYQPPPPQPLGAVVADKKAKQIFVYEGTRAWDAWIAFKRRTSGVPSWNLSTTVVVDGKPRRGWFFATLFPPQSTGPPSPAQSDSDEFEIV